MSTTVHYQTLAAFVLVMGVPSVNGCASAPRRTQSPPPPPVELSLEAATVRRATATETTSSTASTEESSTNNGSSTLSHAVQQALDERLPTLAQCYEDTLRQAPDAVGRMSIEISIGPNGTPERIDVHVEGEGGLASARPCVEQALRSMRISNAPPQGMRIRRSYSFVNPPVDITVSSPLTVTARRPGRRPVTTTPTSNTATGLLTETEITNAVGEHVTELQNCYATLLRTARTASGNATLQFTIHGDGQVSEASLSDTTPPLDGMNQCITDAVRTWRFRATGTGARVRYPLQFTR